MQNLSDFRVGVERENKSNGLRDAHLCFSFVLRTNRSTLVFFAFEKRNVSIEIFATFPIWIFDIFVREVLGKRFAFGVETLWSTSAFFVVVFGWRGSSYSIDLDLWRTMTHATPTVYYNGSTQKSYNPEELLTIDPFGDDGRNWKFASIVK